jgi:uroporphyrin-III C-methyltransferase
MTKQGQLQGGRHADTEVFYMAGRQLAALSRRLIGAGWPPETPVAVVSRAGWPDQHGSDHRVDTLPEAVVLHGGRPTVVIVGIGATALSAAPSSEPDSMTLTAVSVASKP